MCEFLLLFAFFYPLCISSEINTGIALVLLGSYDPSIKGFWVREPGNVAGKGLS